MRRLAILAVVALLAGCGDDEPPGGDPAQFCERLDRLTRNDPFLAFGDTATPMEIKEAFEALIERTDELVEVAPDEARAAARDYAEATEALDSLMAGAGYDGAAVDARSYRSENLSYAEAADRLLRYLEDQC